MKRIADTSGYFSTHENLNKCCMIKATVYSDEKNNRVVIKCYSANNLSRLDAIKNVYISNDEYESLTDKYDAYNVSVILVS